MKVLIKVAGTAVVMKESIKEQPCVWSLTALAIATVVKLIYDIGYARKQLIISDKKRRCYNTSHS